MADKTLIIGGVAGGATTAARLRRRDEVREIILFERGEYISYANCGLPYYVGDVIRSREALLLQTPKTMKKKYNIDVRISSEVTRILPMEKRVEVKNLRTGELYEETYDQLVLATGSSPLRPNIPGIDSEKVFTLWTVPDTDAVKEYIREKQPRRAAVVGGGFIGLEMAENLVKAGLSVSVIEMQNQVMAPLDLEMARLLQENMADHQVELILEDGVKAFREEGSRVRIGLHSGRSLEADMVLLAIGVRPNSELAREAGLKCGARGGIQVDEYLRTSEPDIYALGDVAETIQLVSGERTMIPLAGPANKQARILADNLAGDHKPYEGSLGTAVAQIFDLNAASVGLNEKQLRAAGRVKNQDYHTVLINQKSHAGYYPGAVTVTLKLLFDKKGRILGAQAVGQDGVDKRIDTIATVMRMNGTISDLSRLELAYAPPFSSAKDPVNMLGFTAENVLKGLVSFVEWEEMDALLKSGRQDFTVLDVTEDIERSVFAIPDSCHIPLGQLRERFRELDSDKRIITYCAVGVRAYNAARILMQNGFNKVSVLSGGLSFYKSMHYQDHIMGMELMAASAGEAESGIQAGNGSVSMAASGEKAGDGTRPGNSSVSQTLSAEKAGNGTERITVPEEKMRSGAGLSGRHDSLSEPEKEIKALDCCGLQCPGPIMKVYEALSTMQEGGLLKVSATDLGFARDVEAWCRRTGNTLVKAQRSGSENIVYIRKGVETAPQPEETGRQSCQSPQGKTIIVFSGDLDKVLASFIIANGAASMGRPVTMFFTFWGLNVLRKPEKKKVRKPFMDRMFGAMMPRGSRKLKLSKLNMAGMGTAMMKKVMNDKNVDSLEALIQKAMKNGVKLVACTMSMDIMGITKEELIDGVELAGVASYLGDAEESNVNLFI